MTPAKRTGMDVNKLNVFGAYIAILIMTTGILIFAFRMARNEAAEYWTGILFMLSAIPLIYLLFTAFTIDRPTIYFVQLVVMIGFITLELMLDYVLKVDFRSIRWASISYVIFFFAGTGGMIGVASLAGRPWMIASIVLFFAMTALAFLQHIKTGL